MQRFIAIVLIACGITMLYAGLWHFKEISVGHLIFGAIAVTAGFYCLILTERFTQALDEKTGRNYRFTKQSENPHHAKCPRCSRISPLIIATEGNPKHRKGVKCAAHGVLWYDLEEK